VAEKFLAMVQIRVSHPNSDHRSIFPDSQSVPQKLPVLAVELVFAGEQTAAVAFLRSVLGAENKGAGTGSAAERSDLKRTMTSTQIERSAAIVLPRPPGSIRNRKRDEKDALAYLEQCVPSPSVYLSSVDVLCQSNLATASDVHLLRIHKRIPAAISDPSTQDNNVGNNVAPRPTQAKGSTFQWH